jgi:hypothetical protein
MGRGQRHSKNAGIMGSEALTYHERKALGFGTVKERIGKVGCWCDFGCSSNSSTLVWQQEACLGLSCRVRSAAKQARHCWHIFPKNPWGAGLGAAAPCWCGSRRHQVIHIGVWKQHDMPGAASSCAQCGAACITLNPGGC